MSLSKFDQCNEVRNLNVSHNRENFINLTILEVLQKNGIIKESATEIILNSNKKKIKDFMFEKVKNVYIFDFLKSSYFKMWINDPLRIYQSVRMIFNILDQRRSKIKSRS